MNQQFSLQMENKSNITRNVCLYWIHSIHFKQELYTYTTSLCLGLHMTPAGATGDASVWERYWEVWECEEGKHEQPDRTNLQIFSELPYAPILGHPLRSNQLILLWRSAGMTLRGQLWLVCVCVCVQLFWCPVAAEALGRPESRCCWSNSHPFGPDEKARSP